jgi:Rrf2 family protein
MQLSVGVEYALHCLIHMVELPTGKSIGVKDIATYQGISETYLSKIYTKLRKSGIVKSIPGVKGGYALARTPKNITFWDVIEAIEGSSSIFQCAEIRQNELLLDKKNLPEAYTKCPCLIKTVMSEAEEQMRRYLRDKTLYWLFEKVNNKVPSDVRNATKEWFNNL